MFLLTVGLFIMSFGCTIITFLASYENYPSGYALKYLHQNRIVKTTKEQWTHIDSFPAMNGISRFCENDFPWRYSKEEGIALDDFQYRNYTYLISEHSAVPGYDCLFSVKGFSRIQLKIGFPPIILVTVPKAFVLGNLKEVHIQDETWPGCSLMAKSGGDNITHHMDRDFFCESSMAARQRPSITQMLSAMENPDDSQTARRLGRPNFKFVFPFDVPATPEALAVRIIKNLSHFCLFYSLLLWAGLTISLVPIQRTSLHILLSMTAVTNSYVILLRLMPQPMFMHRAMDKAAVLLALGIVTAVALILTGAAMHLFLTCAIGLPMVVVHAAFWRDDLRLTSSRGNIEEASVRDFVITLIDGIRSHKIGV